ncbi:MAG: beta-ketoacyl synthase chain length factor [Pseudomonadota bacterium]|nr:beta-ketoacyl synthase chain length factor [Pseudomonadota bacterium]
MPGLAAYIDGIGLLGPGLPNWTVGEAVLSGNAPYVEQLAQLPAAATLPAAERRRVGRVVKLALAIGYQAAAAAGQDPSRLATVFTASAADGDICHEICQMLATSDRRISPTRFHNSVHNAPAGYWSIATGAKAPSTSLCAFDGSFCAGLLEALCQVLVAREPVLLIAYDTCYPEPLHRTRPIADAFGIALLLSTERGEPTLGRVDAELTADAADVMADPPLESLRMGYPAARGLPLLMALARGQARRQVLDYLDDRRLAVTTTPCR